MSDRVVHFEIPFDDGERATGFYGEAFGWDVNAMPQMQYVMVSTGPSEQGPPSEPGFINGGMLQRWDVGTPVITISVDDIDASLEKIEKLGGTTVRGREPVGDMGFAAYFKDTEGNVLGLWQNA